MTDQTIAPLTGPPAACYSTKCSHPEQKGYVEDELQRRVVYFLRDRGVPESHSLNVEADRGTVAVRGSLPSSYAKWLCLECCRHVAGVITLVDDVNVESLVTPATLAAG